MDLLRLTRVPPDGRPATYHRYLFAPWHVVVNVIAASPLCPAPVRAGLYRLAGIEIRSQRLMPAIFFESGRVTIGEDTLVNAGTAFFGHGRVTLGNHCAVGSEVHFSTNTHLPRPTARAGELIIRPIVVGEGSWIGSRAVLLPGVTVGARCIIAAGAVVASDCAPDGLYAGVPAVRKRDLPPLPE